MKIAKYCLAAGGSLLLLAGTNQAQSASHWYVNGGVGGAFADNETISASAFGNNGDVKFNPGVRGDLEIGRQLKPDWAVELETGVIWNGVKSIAGNTPNEGASADMYQVPFLGKLVYKPFHGAFQPYLSAGCGGVESIFSMSSVSSGSSLGLYAPGFTASDVSFAYQVEAGVRFPVANNWDLGLAYKFLGTTEHSWTDHGVNLSTDSGCTHSIEASLTWHF